MTCPACKDVRLKRCDTCGEPVNSYPDFRVARPAPQVYERVSGWLDPVRQDVPERPLQEPRR